MKLWIQSLGALLILIGGLCVAAVLILVAGFSDPDWAPTGKLLFLGATQVIVGWFLYLVSDRKVCPDCQEVIRKDAYTCRYCSHKFSAA